MKSRRDRRRSACPISFTLDLLGDRWTLLVVRDLLLLGKKHYGQLLTSAEGIATNILADRLRRLEEEGIISREEDPENGKRIVYRMTEKGEELRPILVEMVAWGAKYDPRTGAPRSLVRKLRKDRR